ncbi:hypothetical protein BD770DRAFT_409964 [Pilaira anomala]|nr:hypothetical protein BD770DRAFT_409964 [Pilaira anomala]
MSNIEFAVPDKTISVLGPEIINQLKFYVCSTNKELAQKVLEYALVNCPHFHDIEYHGMNTPRHRPKQRLYPIARSEEVIKFIRINNFVPSFDVLNTLVSYLPSIRCFSCGTESFRGFGDEQTSQAILVNLSKSTNLELFYFDIRLI